MGYRRLGGNSQAGLVRIWLEVGSGYISSTIVLRKIKTRHALKKALVVITVYGTGHATKLDEFSELGTLSTYVRGKHSAM